MAGRRASGHGRRRCCAAPCAALVVAAAACVKLRCGISFAGHTPRGPLGADRGPAPLRVGIGSGEGGMADLMGVSSEETAAALKMAQKFEDVLLTGSKLWEQMKKKGKTPKIFLVGLRGSLGEEMADALASGMSYIQPADGTLMMHRKSFVKYPETDFNHLDSDKAVEKKCYGIKDANGRAMGPVAVFKENEEKYRDLETDVLREFLEESIDGPAAIAVGDTALNKPENLDILKQGLVIHLRIPPETSWAQMKGRRAVLGGPGASGLQVKEPVWFEAQGWDNKDLEDAEVRQEYYRIGNALIKEYDNTADIIYDMKSSDFENFFWASEKIFNQIGLHLGVMEETSSEDGTDADLERELSTFLEDTKLLKYLPRAMEWCEEQGAASMEDLVDSPDDFADGLGLKPLERKRLLKGLAPLG